MPFKFETSRNASDPSDEYVMLKATGVTNNLANCAIVDTTFRPDGKQSNIYRHIFLFPAKAIAKGEYVVLWSGSGEGLAKKSEKNGNVYHHSFWNSDECVWNNKGDKAHLIKFERKGEVIIPPIRKT